MSPSQLLKRLVGRLLVLPKQVSRRRVQVKPAPLLLPRNQAALLQCLKHNSNHQPSTQHIYVPYRLIFSRLVIPVLEKREFPPQFAEQIQILKGLRAFKTRKWTARAATLKTISGASLVIPMWTREGDFAGEGQPGFVGSTSRRASVDGALETAAQAPTWVCPEESCRKVFDAKEKWRRHQAVHKKKLQLKLPNLSRIKEQQSQQQALPTSMADEPPTVLDSMPPSELGLSKLDSEL